MSISHVCNAVRRLQQNQIKHQIHQEIICQFNNVIRGTPNDGLHLLTLPGTDWTFERALLDSSTRAARQVSSIVGIEAKDELIKASRTTKRELIQQYPRVDFDLLHTTDYRVWEPSGLGGAPNNDIRRRARVGEGYDLVWLDYMQYWGTGTHAGIGAFLRDITVFRRAWDAGRPGLLYITLNVGKEYGTSMDILRTALVQYGICGYEKVAGVPMYSLRVRGLVAYLNHISKLVGVYCFPFYNKVYKEYDPENPKRKVMMIVGFDVAPIAAEYSDRKMARCIRDLRVYMDYGNNN